MSADRLVAVVCVRAGIVVKSYGYRTWRPAGRLRSALRNLDRWSADEIIVLDVSRRPSVDLDVRTEIAAAAVATPIAYGGGLRRAEDLGPLLDAGCDRFVVEELLLTEDTDELGRCVDLVGRQALIGSVPVVLDEDHVVLHPAPWAEAGRIDAATAMGRVEDGLVAELFVTSTTTEGHGGSFPLRLLDLVPTAPDGSIIWFGGLDARSGAACLAHRSSSAVAFGNLLHESELVLVGLRDEIRALAGPAPTLRPVAPA